MEWPLIRPLRHRTGPWNTKETGVEEGKGGEGKQKGEGEGEGKEWVCQGKERQGGEERMMWRGFQARMFTMGGASEGEWRGRGRGKGRLCQTKDRRQGAGY